jgi:hypothetical protein
VYGLAHGLIIADWREGSHDGCHVSGNALLAAGLAGHFNGHRQGLCQRDSDCLPIKAPFLAYFCHLFDDSACEHQNFYGIFFLFAHAALSFFSSISSNMRMTDTGTGAWAPIQRNAVAMYACQDGEIFGVQFQRIQQPDKVFCGGVDTGFDHAASLQPEVPTGQYPAPSSRDILFKLLLKV